MAGVIAEFSHLVWQHRLMTMPDSAWFYWPLLFLLGEFFYYWFHRLSHTCRWFWATHAVHHSPQHFYLSGAFRLGWTGQLTGGFLFFMPLLMFGFKPSHVFTVIGLNLIYQFWLHTELIGNLGWFDQWFNSPSNHRAHHATELQYLDKNFGGVTMLFDHSFGTYQAENPAQRIVQFGLRPNINSYNPAIIALHEWASIWQALIQQRSLIQWCRILWGRPPS